MGTGPNLYFYKFAVSYRLDPDELNLPEPEELSFPEPDELNLPEPEELSFPDPDELNLPEPEELSFPEPDELNLPEPEELSFPDPDELSLLRLEKLSPSEPGELFVWSGLEVAMALNSLPPRIGCVPTTSSSIASNRSAGIPVIVAPLTETSPVNAL